MTERKARGVIFDLDGTLYTLRWAKLRMTLALWRSAPILARLTAARKDLRGEVFASRDDLIAALHAAIARRAGTSIARAEEWYHGEFLPAFIELLGREAAPRSGVAALLERLRAGGVRTAVISDYARIADRLRALKIDPALFDDLIAAEDHGVLKPSAVPFVALAKAWGLEPAEVLVVGDRKDLDEESAWASGMEFLGVIGERSPGGNRGYASWQDASREIEARTGCGVTR